MQPATKENIYKYVAPSSVLYYVLAAFFFLMGLPMASLTTDDKYLSLIFLGFGILLLCMGVFIRSKVRKQLDALEESGELPAILADFSQSYSLVDGKVRLGQRYVFGRKTGALVRYEDIQKIYQYIQRYMFIETYRDLRYVNPKGKVKSLCQLKRGKKSQDDVLKIMGFIQKKNPSVHLGYR